MSLLELWPRHLIEQAMEDFVKKALDEIREDYLKTLDLEESTKAISHAPPTEKRERPSPGCKSRGDPNGKPI